jgi:hypothetical protein
MTTRPHDSVLRALRDVVPQRRLTFGESLRLAELQANKLLELFDVRGPLVPSELITELPRLEVRYEPDLPVSGSAHWEAGRWVITLNAAEPFGRRRYSLAHEFKHVLDHTTKQFLYGDVDDPASAEKAERAADHFAACLLMPRRWTKRVWIESGQKLSVLAKQLQVSPRALSVRLWHLGLAPSTQRCSGRGRIYYRARPELVGDIPSPLGVAA